MKLLIVAGGGGHFAPALAVIEQLPKDVEVLVVGRKYTFEAEKTESLEYKTAQQLGIAFEPLTTGRLQRRLTPYTFLSLAKIPVGYFQALGIVKQFKPDVVLSFGGYVSVPVAFAAKTLGIPVIIHEQILRAGLANKIVATFAKKVCVSWKESTKFFPETKVVVTGNPIRKVQSSKFKVQSFDDKFPLIYVTGGSSGAHAINELIEQSLEKLLQKYTIVHQTGDSQTFADFDRLKKKKEELPEALQKRYIVTKFVDASEVFSLMDQAALVISRSGINTVTELLSLGKPCLLIPLPHGQHNEQLTNALFVKQKGIADVATQEELTGEKLYDLITKMFEQIDEYKKHGITSKEEIIPDAAKNIISIVEHVNNETKNTRA